MIAAAARPVADRRNLPLLGVVAVSALVAAVGFVLAGLIATHRLGEAEQGAGALAIGQPVPTSFGSVTVQAVEHLNGLTAQDLGGADHASHGIRDLTPADKVQVIVSLILTNRLPRPVDLSADQFRLISDRSDEPIEPTGGSAAANTMRAGTSMELAVRFVVPRDGAALWLEFDEPGRPVPARVALGTTDRVPDRAGAGSHTH